MIVSSRGMRAITAAALAAILSGCAGGEEPPAAAPAPSASPTDGEPTSGEPSEDAETETGETSPSLPPGVEPATGQQVEFDGMSYRLPENFRIIDEDDSRTLAMGTEDTFRYINTTTASSVGVEASVSVLARQWLRANQFLREPEILDPVVIDGVRMFHAAGVINSGEWLEAYGGADDEFDYTFEMTFRESTTPAKERRAQVESVIATLDLNP